MNTKPRILISVGTRPEIIKMAPVYFELKNRGVEPLLLHTGQHDDMAQQLYKLWNITPDYCIELQRKALDPKICDLSALTSLLLEKTSGILMEAKPSMVMVHGDTSSALAMGLAAFYRQLKIAHVESGLRSSNEYHPFPEEKNRMLIAQLAHFHFAPTEKAKANLLKEGISADSIHMVGNTIVQATRLGASMLNKMQVTSLHVGVSGTAGLQVKSSVVTTLADQMIDKRLILVTAHRRENHDEGISNISKAVIQLLQAHQDLLVVWPMHPNPKVQDKIKNIFAGLPDEVMSRVHLTGPMEYPTLLWMLKNAWVVLTDSGGIQEEAVALNTPVLVLRETTERPEVVESGAGLLVGTDTNHIIEAVEALQADPERYQKMRTAINPFGDDLVAKRICDILLERSAV